MYPPDDGHLGYIYSCFLSIVNEAAVSTLVQVFLKTCISMYFG